MAVREFFFSLGTVVGLRTRPIPTSAVQPCPNGSMNCIRTTWTPMDTASTTSAEEASKLIRNCIAEYPQDGQNGIDKGGWSIVDDQIDKKEDGSTRVEFRSGVGRLAKILNRGKPFIDDLLVATTPDGAIEIRSSSRKGYDDQGVNKKRIQYLAKSMPAAKWHIPEPKYGKQDSK